MPPSGPNLFNRDLQAESTRRPRARRQPRPANQAALSCSAPEAPREASDHSHPLPALGVVNLISLWCLVFSQIVISFTATCKIVAPVCKVYNQ